MKLAATAAAASTLGVMALAACGTANVTVPPAVSTPSPVTSSPPSTPAPAPSVAGTNHAAPTTPAPTQAPTQAPATQAAPAGSPNVTDPWAVVSAFYGDVESGDFKDAWALLNYGATTGQTYQQFVNGYSCTGSQQLNEVSESGNQVTFDLAATNSCTGQVQHFAGTDTVENGKIVAANVSQTG